jgi:pimeloyl-ACP methyl ester carboxylesterase
MTDFTIPTPHEILDLTMEDGAVIRVRRHGNIEGPRLILAHGNGFAIDAYYPFWRLLTDRYDVVLYDQRNHGHNPRHNDIAHHDVPYFVTDMNHVIDGVRDGFGEKPTAGMFHSISGVSAIAHAYQFGWRWDALVLFDPPLVPSPGHRCHEVARDFELMLAAWSKDRPEQFKSPEELAAQFIASKSLNRWGRRIARANGAIDIARGSSGRRLEPVLSAGRREQGLRDQLNARPLPPPRRADRPVQDHRQRPRRPTRASPGIRQPGAVRGFRTCV